MKRNIPFAALTAAALSMGTSASAANIVEIASGDARFSTLVAAVSAAGLAETLQGEGPFTVFAPVNDAFAPCPKALLKHCLSLKTKTN